MKRVLLLQLPIPKLNYGIKTGNIPLGAACLKQAAEGIPGVTIDILPENLVSYIGDAALIELIEDINPDITGFTVFSWNVERSLYIAERIKKNTGTRIIFGGPEITPDNDLIKQPHIDFHVYGEGEAVFLDLLQHDHFWERRHAFACAESIFKPSVSPYQLGFVEYDIQNLMLLETQRGCPYQCGFCYYNKSRRCVTFKDESSLLEGIRWAVDHAIDELYLLDPSLNARPGLKETLKKIARINNDSSVAINSEIRAEWIDSESADLFEAAGFTGFEIGLQTTNKHALSIMKRPTSLTRFIKGATLLQERGILPRIDLISGLPGDDIDGFNRSIGFVSENGLYDDVQVFPLSILPGTEFRQRSNELGITFEPSPPYTVLETETFSRDDMLLSFDYAESLFDVTLFPMPDLDVSWKRKGHPQSNDVYVTINDSSLISKLFLTNNRSIGEIDTLSHRLTFPYQVFVNFDVTDQEYIASTLKLLSLNNPFSPFEVVFLNPKTIPDTARFLDAIRLKRPHFLDNDLRFLYGAPGNRAVLFTLVSSKENIHFSGEMKRQIFHWTRPSLPEPAEIDALSDFDGILIDSGCANELAMEWQEHFAPSANYIPLISFSDMDCQKNWLGLISGDEYHIGAMNYR